MTSRWWLVLVAACYRHDPDVACTVGCEDGLPCPSGLACGMDGVCKSPGAPDCADVEAAWLPGYSHRRSIAITPPSPTPLTGFAVAVVLTGDVPLSQATSTDGLGVVFTEADGTSLLASEVELLDPGNGNLAAWVRIPVLAGPRRIYLYDGGVPSTADPRDTWDGGYAAVWHLAGGNAAKTADSTARGNDLLQSVAGQQPVISEGIVGEARRFGGDDDLDTTTTGIFLPSSVQSFSYSVWINTMTLPASGVFEGVFYNGANNNNVPGFDIERTDGDWRTDFSDGTLPLAAGQFTTNGMEQLLNRWHYLAAIVDREASKLAVFVDGEFRNSADITNYGAPAHPGRTVVGSLDGSSFYNGDIDEVRLYTSALDPAWFAAEYANLMTPASFLAFGADETAP